MKTLLLSAAIMALMPSFVHAQGQASEPGGHIRNDGPRMSTGDIMSSWSAQPKNTETASGKESVVPEGQLQRISTPAMANPSIDTTDAKTPPSWEEGFGWQKAQLGDPPVDVFQVSADSWGSQALSALETLRRGDVYISETGEEVAGSGQIDQTQAQRWEESILAAEQRLIQRLIKARAAGEKYLIWVNMPAYRLRVLDTSDGSVVMESRVIIGKPGRATPRMDTRIINLKFNPDWTPPKSSPGSRYTPSGPASPLGRVRFSADNGIGIYLHDTNRHDLFDTKTRAYSLGCVRVESWRDLVTLLSGEDEAWIDDKTRDWKIRWVDTPDVTAFLDYQRVDFDDDGRLIEAADIYKLGNRVK